MTLGYFATYIDISLNLKYVNETNGKIKYDLTLILLQVAGFQLFTTIQMVSFIPLQKVLKAIVFVVYHSSNMLAECGHVTVVYVIILEVCIICLDTYDICRIFT